MLRVFLVIDDYNELIYLQSLLKKLGLDVEGVQNQKKYADMSLGFNPHVLIASAKGKKVDGLQLTQSLYRKRGLPKVIILKTPDQPVNVDDLKEAGVDEVLDSPVSPRKLILSIAGLGGVDETALLEKYAKIKGQLGSPAEDDTAFVSSYDENGQPVENVRQIRKHIQDATQVGSDSDGEDDEAQGAIQFPLKPEARAARTSLDPDSSEEVSLGEPLSEAESEHEVEARGKSERELRYEEWARKVGPLEPHHFVRDRILDFNKKIRSRPVVEDQNEIEDERKKFVKALFRNGGRK